MNLLKWMFMSRFSLLFFFLFFWRERLGRAGTLSPISENIYLLRNLLHVNWMGGKTSCHDKSLKSSETSKGPVQSLALRVVGLPASNVTYSYSYEPLANIMSHSARHRRRQSLLS